MRDPAWKRLARRLWGPLPWMLEGTIVLTLALGKVLEGAIIAVLLLVNTVIGFVQQSRADGALALLRRRLAVNARVRRDGAWTQIPAVQLVPGDVVRIRIGDLVPADLELVAGHVSLDQSSLTGECVPVGAGDDGVAFSGTVVTRGEATGVVTATGSSTMFGRTSVLVREARTATHLESVIFQIVRYLVVDGISVMRLVTHRNQCFDGFKITKTISCVN